MQIYKGTSRRTVHSRQIFLRFVCSALSPHQQTMRTSSITWSCAHMYQLPFDRQRSSVRPCGRDRKKGAFVLGSRRRNNIRSPLYITFLFLGFGSKCEGYLGCVNPASTTRHSRNLFTESVSVCRQRKREREKERTLFSQQQKPPSVVEFQTVSFSVLRRPSTRKKKMGLIVEASRGCVKINVELRDNHRATLWRSM